RWPLGPIGQDDDLPLGAFSGEQGTGHLVAFDPGEHQLRRLYLPRGRRRPRRADLTQHTLRAAARPRMLRARQRKCRGGHAPTPPPTTDIGQAQVAGCGNRGINETNRERVSSAKKERVSSAEKEFVSLASPHVHTLPTAR